LPLLAFAPNFRNVFTFDYTWALEFVKNNKVEIEEVSHKHENDAALLTAIVFPELLRYSLMRDYFETGVLEVIYTKYGSKYADFSIGFFQMKPSFVEALEKAIARDLNLRIEYAPLLLFKSKHEKRIRKERIARLRKLTWQLHYLNAFYEVVYSAAAESFENNGNWLRYLATAYNRGFEQPKTEIERWYHIPNFPYGNKQVYRQQYVYAEVVLDYYQRYSQLFFK